VVSLEVSTDDIHDVKAFKGLLKGAERRRRRRRGELPAGWATGLTTREVSLRR